MHEHDSALFGWMSDNGDPDNFADVLLMQQHKTGSNAALVQIKSQICWYKSKLTSSPAGRAKLWPGAGDFLSPGAVDCARKRKTFYATLAT